MKRLRRKTVKPSVWARPQMSVVFRAEIMPGKSREARTFKIEKVLPNGRAVLHDLPGEHHESAFEPIKYEK